jgi:hypothetical protein
MFFFFFFNLINIDIHDKYNYTGQKFIIYLPVNLNCF